MSFMNREALKKEASKKKFAPAHGYAKSKALESKKGMYTSPTGSKHREGSAKHRYWEGIKKRGAEDEKYARSENERMNR